MEYLYSKVEDATFREDTPERKAFRAHLNKVAKALHDIEWVDSCDCSSGSENEAIMACISNEIILEVLIDEANSASEKLNEFLIKAGESK